MRTRAIVAGVMLAASTPAFSSAEDQGHWWIVVQQDGQGNSHLADSSTLEWRGDGRVYFVEHLFYAYPEEGRKSALIEYGVRCSEGTIGEYRFIDYDANRDTIVSGDNHGEGEKIPKPNTTGVDLIKFACSSDVNRKKRYLRIGAGVDHWTIGEFYSDPRPLTSTRTRGSGQ